MLTRDDLRRTFICLAEDDNELNYGSIESCDRMCRRAPEAEDRRPERGVEGGARERHEGAVRAVSTKKPGEHRRFHCSARYAASAGSRETFSEDHTSTE